MSTFTQWIATAPGQHATETRQRCTGHHYHPRHRSRSSPLATSDAPELSRSSTVRTRLRSPLHGTSSTYSCEVRIQSHIFGLRVFRLRLIFSQLAEMTLCKLLNSLHRYRHLFSRLSSQQRCRLLYSLLRHRPIIMPRHHAKFFLSQRGFLFHHQAWSVHTLI